MSLTDKTAILFGAGAIASGYASMGARGWLSRRQGNRVFLVSLTHPASSSAAASASASASASAVLDAIAPPHAR